MGIVAPLRSFTRAILFFGMLYCWRRNALAVGLPKGRNLAENAASLALGCNRGKRPPAPPDLAIDVDLVLSGNTLLGGYVGVCRVCHRLGVAHKGKPYGIEACENE